MRRHRDSAKCRRLCFNRHRKQDKMGIHLICYVCGCRIDAIRESSKWRADHIARHAEDGPDTEDNLWPICLDCDSVKAPHDTSEVAKGKRVADSLYRLNPSRNPMPGGKNSDRKILMDGTVVDRRTGAPIGRTWRG